MSEKEPMLAWRIGEETRALVDDLIDNAARSQIAANKALARWGRGGWGSIVDKHDGLGAARAYRHVIYRITAWDTTRVEAKVNARMRKLREETLAS